MQCPQCNTENPLGAKFCLSCRAKLVLACTQCGTELPPQASFCFDCGARVAAPSSPAAPAPAVAKTPVPIEAESMAEGIADGLQRLVPREFAERLLAARGQVTKERRVVTILFSDVKGSTLMAKDLDPEDWTEIMEGAFEFLIEPVYRYEGTLVQLMGDAVLAFFGAPTAHEDDPERACRAALEILEGAKRYAARLQEERGIRGFDVRVGINTGLVVVGEVGSDLQVEYTAMGDAVNLAARMEGAAEPGTALITEETHKLVAPLFETQALGSIKVKGRVEPVPVYRVLAPRAVTGKPRGVAGLDSPLVGRSAEFGALQEALEHLRTGVGGIVTVVGEAGIGKSRLVAEVRKQTLGKASVPIGSPESSEGAHGLPPVQWVEGRCLSYGTTMAYALWLDALRSMLGTLVEDPAAAVRVKLRRRLQMVCPDRFDDIYPYLRRLMSLPQGEEVGAALHDLEGEQIKRGTFRAVETLIECAAGQHPLVVVLEDLHWADPTSMELLERLLALTGRVSLLFICVFRPHMGHRCWHIKEISSRDYWHRYTDLRLNPLSASESEVLVGHLLGVGGLSQKLKWRILSHAEGNPFFVEEIIRSLIDDGAIVQDESGGQWLATRDLVDIAIPDTLHGVLMARIHRLPEETRRILQVASVIGRIFLYRVLGAIVEEEAELDEHLITLEREEMIRERARLPEPAYIFKHHLTQEAAYNSLLKKERRILHRRVARALEQLFSDRIEEQVEVLAHHWEQAGEQEKAIDYLLKAGDRARQLGASLEAIDFYQSALQGSAGLESPERVVGLHRIHERLGDVYLEHLSLHAEALEHYESFLGLARSEEDRARGGRKVATVHLLRGDLPEAQRHYEAALACLRPLPPLAETCRVHNGLSHLFLARNQLEEAAQHAAASLEVARRIADIRGLADAYRAMGIIAIHQGDLATACAHDERSLELYRELGDLPRTAQACNNVGDSYRLLGQMDRALERLSEGLDIARQIGDTRGEALLLQTTAELRLDQGRWETAVAHGERALVAAKESGVASRIIEARRILGSAYEAVGRQEDGRQHLEIAESLMRDTQQLRFAPAIYLGLAQLDATLGRFDEAGGYLQRALEAAGPEPSDTLLGLVHRCYGHLFGRRSSWDDAVSHLEESLRFLERTSLLVEVAKTRLSLGVAYGSRGEEGDRGRACEQLLAALSTFQQIEAVGYRTQVDGWVQELECR
jgi:class 3 adenylate cyclase/tetratricopeptide (TPR) repeat protein